MAIYRIFILTILLFIFPSCIYSQSSRNLTLAQFFPHQILLRSTSLTSTSALAYEFYFTTNHAPLFMIDAFKSQDQAKDALHFVVAILGLVEYNDTIAIKDSKSIYSFVDKDPLWSNIRKTVDETNGLKGIETTLIARDQPGNNLNVTISAYATGNTTTIDKHGITLKPSQIKYSFEFNNFPYIYQNSKISIIKMISSKSLFTYNNSTAFTSDSGTYEWNSTILADSNKVDVQVDQKILFQANRTFGNVSVDNTTAQAEVTVKLLAYSVQALQPKNVLWDPTFDITDSSNNSTNTSKSGGNRLFGDACIIGKVGWILTIILTSGFLFI
ncbi:10266_t:CDS:2 [Dentiscutata erythropus]|uniref:10266_t:CDS:1 n=1 Tax=Dentiscutata erythropus TaxID=1348616 RepID=A0A9N9FFF2_9GLOM|nr:10266_t:CDS:2 [Dentiscutata erythropus]